MIILALIISLSLRFLSTLASEKSANGTPIHVSSTLPGNEPPVSRSGTTPGTSTPTQSSNHPGIQLLQLSSDPYTNSGSQHKTEVEPGMYSYGSTIVAAFQAGRFSDRGSSNIGWATSTDGGMTWQHGFLPGTTTYAGGPYARITDPSVAYDAAHHTWMIITIVFLGGPGGVWAPAVLASLSTDGMSWGKPVTVANVGGSGYLDKDWVVCDNTPASRYYGNCYIEWDESAGSNLIQMSTSRNGGRSWGAARTTINRASGFDGEPLVQPNGTVIVPLSNANETAVMAFVSHDGGASWSQPITIVPVISFSKRAYFRDNILLTAGIDGSGKVYLAWVDCRFENGCQGNDLVMTTSTNGIGWTPIRRIPIAAVGSGVNYYVSAVGVDASTSGSSAHVGLVYYYYAAGCVSNCKLSVGFISSINGGIAWNAKTPLAGPFPASWIAQGNNKVGDYICVSFSHGRAFPVFAVATSPSAGHLNEAMYTAHGGIEP